MDIYFIEDENLREIFTRIDTSLGNVEVKGDSVSHLFTARTLLKDLFTRIEKREEIKAKEE